MNIERRNNFTRKPQKRLGGFTLLEVLVALALMGMAVTVVLQLFSANLKAISASESYVSGSLEAQAKMREVLDGKDFSERSWSGVTETGYRFEVAVSDTLAERSENLQVKLVQIEVKVFWTQGAKERKVTLRTLKEIEKKV